MDSSTPVRCCAVEGCRRKYYAKGLCGMHYQRQRVKSELGSVGSQVETIRETVEIPCRSCGVVKPRTLEYFIANHKGHNGTGTVCRNCNSGVSKRWRENNPQKAKQNKKDWAKANPDKEREMDARSYKKHRRKRLKRCAEYYESNPAPVKRSAREWRIANPEAARALSHRRIARKHLALGTHTAKDVKAKLELQGGRCYYCRCDLAGGYHVDHKIPLAKGGSNWPANLCCACPTCNCRKKAKNFWEFRAQINA